MPGVPTDRGLIEGRHGRLPRLVSWRQFCCGAEVPMTPRAPFVAVVCLCSCVAPPPEDEAPATTDPKGDQPGFSCLNLPPPATATVDGRFTGWDPNTEVLHEWSCGFPAQGVYSYLYLRFAKGRLQVLNDWKLRDDQDICPGMYNLFRLTTGAGAQQWEIRVYGDGKGKVLLNGKDYPLVESAYGYFASPKHSKPHTIFEFAIGTEPGGVGKAQPVIPGPMTLWEHDPGTAASLLGFQARQGGPVGGCADPDAALVAEPTVFTGTLDAGGSTTYDGAKGPVLAWLAPKEAAVGATVAVSGAGLGKDTGKLLVGDVEAKVTLWQDDRVVFTVPQVAAGERKVVAKTKSANSNPQLLQVPAAPPKKTDCKGEPDGSVCDDGKDCTIGDQCQQGKCAPGPIDCGKVANPCVTVACNPTSGKCETTNTDVITCDDGNPCTTKDACYWGTCEGKTPTNCGDGDPCTDDPCDKATGCLHAPAPSGTPCDDGDKCTKDDICQIAGKAGKCVGGKATCDAGKQPCTYLVCEPTQGCVPKVLDPGAPCDDGDACTKNEACSGTQCGGGKPTCDDGKPCTGDSCDQKGTCSHEPIAAGGPCSDDNACTTKDTCAASGACGGEPIVCDDKDDKTMDSCDPKVGCVFTKK
jgi:hypothetical protein